MSGMSKSRRKFSKEFKSEIVQLVLSGNKTVPQVAKEHALHESSVYNWVRQAKIDDGQGPSDAMTTAEREELAQLRRENRNLRRERDFLKDAAAYFAKAKK